MVTALAQAYDERFRFCKGNLFGMFWENDNKLEIHLRHIIFNATEFKTGIGFRFHFYNNKTQCDSGSDRVVLPEDFAKEARLADILAASTCIPVGLEPLEFPHDFRWPDDEKKVPKPEERNTCNHISKLFNERFNQSSVPLMDGAVIDNQGITSVIRALELEKGQAQDTPSAAGVPETRTDLSALGLMRTGAKEPSWLELMSQQQRPGTQPPESGGLDDYVPLLAICPKCRTSRIDRVEYFGVQVERCPDCHGMWFDENEVHDLIGHESALDLFIVSDTPLREDPVYVMEEVSTQKIFSLGAVRLIANILVVLSLISALSLFLVVKNLPDDIYQAMGGFFYFVFPLIMILTFLVSAVAIGHWFRRGLRSIPGMKVSAWKFLKKLKVGDLLNMTYLRLTSTWAMTTDIFMNRIRFLGYSMLFSQRRFKRKIVANEIDSLLRTDDVHGLPDWLEPTEQMTDVIVQPSAKIPTKLMLNPPTGHTRGEFETLIACGQTTICYNLLAHMLINCTRDGEDFENKDVHKFFHRLKEDWLTLKKDAFFFVDERKGAAE
jgi:Zn-finger nucleic acid-binding protein